MCCFYFAGVVGNFVYWCSYYSYLIRRDTQSLKNGHQQLTPLGVIEPRKLITTLQEVIAIDKDNLEIT